MTRDLILGIDAGTSVIKTVAFTLAGEQIAVASRPNLYEAKGRGAVEQDMARTWTDTAATLRELAGLVPDLAARTAALAVTAQGDGMFLIDEAGEPVAPAWLWLDSRAADVMRAFRGTAADELRYAATATGINPCQQSMQLAWMKRHRPEVLERAATAFHCKDWLYFNLTGVRATDPSEAGFTFGNIRTRGYDLSLLDLIGIADLERLLPPIVDGADAAHPLTAAGAAATGLLEGTPVVLGYVDVLCTALGGGFYDPRGEIGCTILGSTGMHMRLRRSPADIEFNPARSGYTMAFPVKPMVAQMQSNMAATLNIDWVLDLIRDAASIGGAEMTRKELIARLDDMVLAAEPGAAVFHPYISEAGERGPFVDPDARAQFFGLSMKTRMPDMVRSVVEGLGFAAADCYAVLGGAPREVRLSGGSARSKALRRILAAALDADVVCVAREEAGAAGAVMIATCSLGHHRSMDEAAAVWVNPLLGPPERPDPTLVGLYARLYEVYRGVRETMPPAWAALAAIRTGAAP